MNLDPGTKEILELLLSEGKNFDRMDGVLLRRLLQVLAVLLSIDSVSELSSYGSFNLKSFDEHYQINVDGEKRMWFEIHNGEILVTYFGSTDHKHGKKK